MDFKAEDIGYYRDKAFRILKSDGCFKVGENIISLEINYTPSAELIENIAKAKVFETEKNKLTYDVEIEPIYIVGKFSVQTPEEFEKLENNAIRFKGNFVIAEPPKEVELANIESQGFPFFAGSMTLSQKVNLEDNCYKIKFRKYGINAVKAVVNGKKLNTLMWAPFEWDISDYVTKGENEIEITLINNLRNLMGPHHDPMGDNPHPGPVNFRKLPSLWTKMEHMPWTDDYSFVKTGIEEA